MAAGLAAPAQGEAHVFDALYFVEGKINDSSPASPLGVNGRNVVFYELYPQVIRVASARTFEDGRYTINIFDNSNITIDPAAHYFVAVERGTDNHGADQIEVNLSRDGFVETNLTLAAGAGPIPIAVDEGPVMLDITRAADAVGSELIIIWSINTAEFPTLGPDQPIDVYMLTGDGSGRFTTGGTSWTKIIENNALTPAGTGFTLGVPTKTFVYPNQVGRDPKEVYFKGLVTGSSIDDATYGLPGAAAAGKYNAVVAKPASGASYKYSFVSVPFVTPDPSTGAVFGSQVPSAANSGNATELWGWTGTTFGNQMFLSSTGWQTISGFTPVSVTVGQGYVFKTKSASATEDRTLTTVGKVLNVPFGPVKVGANLYTFIGNPYPTKYGLKSAGFSASAGVHGSTASGNADQYWGWTGNTFGEQDFYNSTADDWQALSSFTLLDGLGPSRTLVYKRNPGAPGGGFNWRLSP